MGEFTSDHEPPENASDKEEDQPTSFATDVEGVNANSEVKQGNVSFPCFDVTKGEFYQNMQAGRRRLRFKSGTDAQQYHSKSKYQRPFYVSYTDSKGKTFQRKIK